VTPTYGAVQWLRIQFGQHIQDVIDRNPGEHGLRRCDKSPEVPKRLYSHSNARPQRFCVSPASGQRGPEAPTRTRLPALNCLKERCNALRRHFRSNAISHTQCRMPHLPEPNGRIRTCILRARAPPGYASGVVWLPTQRPSQAQKCGRIFLILLDRSICIYLSFLVGGHQAGLSSGPTCGYPAVRGFLGRGINIWLIGSDNRHLLSTPFWPTVRTSAQCRGWDTHLKEYTGSLLRRAFRR